MTETTIGTERPSVRMPAPIGAAAFAGAVAAGLALGLTELFAGLFERIPSAVASVGSYVVDGSPPFARDFAIEVFGTADKGALAIGTAVVSAIIGALVGRGSLKRPWLNPAAFTLFAGVGIVASLSQVNVNVPLAAFGIVLSATVGWVVLRGLLRALEGSVDPTDSLPGDAGRRRLIGGMAGVGVAAFATGSIGRNLIIARSETVRETVGLPTPVTTLAPPAAANSFDIPGITPIVVPNDRFYRIDTALVVPRPDPVTWRLNVSGLVSNPLTLSMDEIHSMDLHEQHVTIACVSNKVGGDLVGNAKWTGVRLTEVLDMAGVNPEVATQIVGRSVDGWTAGFPTELAYDGRDPLIVIGMNDEPLPPSHGFPARLIVPGLYGYVSATKWLEEIELTTWDAFDGYWVPRGWSKEGPIKTQTRIDVPTSRGVTTPTKAGGVAWSPQFGVIGVQVRVDRGDWMDAEISIPLADSSWVQWQYPLNLPPGNYDLEARAIDGTGQPQTEVVAPPRPNGASGYHRVRIRIVA